MNKALLLAAALGLNLTACMGPVMHTFQPEFSPGASWDNRGPWNSSTGRRPGGAPAGAQYSNRTGASSPSTAASRPEQRYSGFFADNGPENIKTVSENQNDGVQEGGYPYWMPPGDGNAMPSGDIVYRDRSGRITGTEWTSPAGNTTRRDGDGRIVAVSTTSPAGTTTTRDGDGMIKTTSSTTPGTGGDSTTTYRNGSGTIVGTKYVSPAGNITWRDGDGRIIDGPRW